MRQTLNACVLSFSLILCCLFLSSSPAQQPASTADQSTARFRWTGVVDGTTIIKVTRRQVEYSYDGGQPVQNERFEFTDELPRTGIQVRLNILEGRGELKLIQEPRSDNNYVAAVEIRDKDRGASPYAFELIWDKPSEANYSHVPGISFFDWKGRVDGQSVIRIRGNKVQIENLSGQGVSETEYRFSNEQGIAAQSQQFSLTGTSGRGEILLLEQPELKNNYTAAVSINDPKGGASEYSFRLTWQPPGFQPAAPADLNKSGQPAAENQPVGVGLKWAGRVDGSVRLRIRAKQLILEHLEGVPVVGRDHTFFKPLPVDPRTASVRKIKGRGEVRILEQPTPANGFTLTIQVDDKKKGSAQYEIEVSW